jgi:Arc/MetJ family transcription regulator
VLGSSSGSNSGKLRDDWASASPWTDTTDDVLADAAEDFGLSIKSATWNTDAT